MKPTPEYALPTHDLATGVRAAAHNVLRQFDPGCCGQ